MKSVDSIVYRQTHTGMRLVCDLFLDRKGELEHLAGIDEILLEPRLNEFYTYLETSQLNVKDDDYQRFYEELEL